MSVKSSKLHSIQTIPGTVKELDGLKKPKAKTKTKKTTKKDA